MSSSGSSDRFRRTRGQSPRVLMTAPRASLDGDLDGGPAARRADPAPGRRRGPRARRGRAGDGAGRRRPGLDDLHPPQARGRRGRGHALDRPQAARGHLPGGVRRGCRRAERRRRHRRDPDPAAAPGADRRGGRDRRARPDQGRRRRAPVQRRPALPRPADARPGDAARDHGAPGRARGRDRRRPCRRRRPERHRRQARRAPPPAGPRDRQHLPHAHGRPCLTTRSTPTCWSSRPASRASSRARW